MTMVTLTHMYMYSMAYMMLTLSMKLVMSPKKTSIATWTRRKRVQWGASPKTGFLQNVYLNFFFRELLAGRFTF